MEQVTAGQREAGSAAQTGSSLCGPQRNSLPLSDVLKSMFGIEIVCT